MPYGTIELNLKRNNAFNEQSTALMTKYYMNDTDNTIQDALARPALAFCGGDSALAQRIYNYASKKWFMYASPILSNAPDQHTNKNTGLPISCFLNFVADSLDGLIAHTTETRWLSVKGGGVGGSWNSVRAISGVAPGPIPFLNTIDADIVAYHQSGTRKGSYAAYLDISHPDIIQFINLRVPTGGAEDTKCFNIHNAVNIPDSFIQAVRDNKTWDLKCPHSGEVHDTLEARDLWQRLLEIRYRTGEPYLNFIDTANAGLPSQMKDKGLTIHGSNLCVAPETLILTKEYGYIAIETIVNEELHVWNGTEWSLTTIRQTSENSELIKVILDNEVIIECTPEHVFYKLNGELCTAKELSVGVALEEFYLPSGELQKFTVIDIKETGRVSPTYCFTEPKLHRGMFNGVLTGNCNEIHLPTDENRTAVCCLSSVNLEKFDEWKDTSLIEDLTTFLDNVLTYFIDNAPKELSKAVFSASQERSIGIGAMGFHALLQRRGILWESEEARELNINIFRSIKSRAKIRTIELAKVRGSCPDVQGLRNSHLLAIAPNANSGILCGTSASIESIKSNAYTHKTRVGSHMVKNNYLKEKLEAIGKDTQEVWENIIANGGSVQQLDFLDDFSKELFKTSFELDQTWSIVHAADRQKFICQGQSVNLFFPEGADKGYLNRIHLLAHASGLKGLYYLKTKSASKATSINSKLNRVALKDFEESESECVACQG